jgi:hypothetical protein
MACNDDDDDDEKSFAILYPFFAVSVAFFTSYQHLLLK